MRALVQLAADASVTPVKAEHLATAQQIPLKFLLEILRQLKQHKLLVSRRGPEGGYTLARPPAQIAIADVIRAVEGPLATVRDTSPATLDYEGPTESLRTVWIAVRGQPAPRPRGRHPAGRHDRPAAPATSSRSPTSTASTSGPSPSWR